MICLFNEDYNYICFKKKENNNNSNFGRWQVTKCISINMLLVSPTDVCLYSFTSSVIGRSATLMDQNKL